MNLLQICLRVFKEKGWPVGVKYLAQDRDATIWAYKGEKPEMSESRWWGTSDWNYEQLTGYDEVEVADDYATAIITQEEFEGTEIISEKKMVIFEDESGADTTDEFYHYFADNYGAAMDQIITQFRKDMNKGVNALAIEDLIRSRLWTERMMYKLSKE